MLRLGLALRSGRSFLHEIWIWLEWNSSTQWRFGLFSFMMFVSGLPSEALQLECVLLPPQPLQKRLHEFLLLRQLLLNALDRCLR